MHKSILSFLIIIMCCVASAFAQGGTEGVLGMSSGNTDVSGTSGQATGPPARTGPA